MDAKPLSEADLAALYTPPRPEFGAGLGFAEQQEWLKVAGHHGQIRRWITDGYSEYLPSLLHCYIYARSTMSGVQLRK
jgi:hypothetical protein